MNDFGEFLYTLRKQNGMTQKALAEALGVTDKAVSKWETGDAMPETSLLLPISRIFGVTVDELLAGKRSPAAPAASSVELDDDGEPIERFDPGKHMFTRGKDEPKTLSELVCGCVCATLILLGLAVYFTLGLMFDLWHPYWVIIPSSALLCGMIGVLFDIGDRAKREKKLARGENPYTGAACGIFMLSCMITYLCLGAFLDLWHPCWIILVLGALCCAVVGTVGTIFTKKRDRNN